jgi:hypothetical protein
LTVVAFFVFLTIFSILFIILGSATGFFHSIQKKYYEEQPLFNRRIYTEPPPVEIKNPTQKVCTDSDGGRDYYTKGTTQGVIRAVERFPNGTWRYVDSGETSITDYCFQGEYDGKVYGDKPGISERYCAPDGRVTVQLYLCPNGCFDGACKK